MSLGKSLRKLRTFENNNTLLNIGIYQLRLFSHPNDLNVAQNCFPLGIYFHGGDFPLKLSDGYSKNFRDLAAIAIGIGQTLDQMRFIVFFQCA